MAQGDWSEVEARAVLEAWKQSGLLLETFAKRRGLIPQRIERWRVKFERAAQVRAAGAPKLLPVRLPEAPRHGEPVTVMLRSGHMLKLSRGFDEDAFVRVVALLEGA